MGKKKQLSKTTIAILEFGYDVSAPDVVEALAKRGIKTNIANVHSARSRHRAQLRKNTRAGKTIAPKKRRLAKKRKAKRAQPAKRKATPRTPRALTSGLHAAGLRERIEKRLEKARGEVDYLEELLGDG